MCYAENKTVEFLETLADNEFTHNYSMMQIKKKNYGKMLGPTPLSNVYLLRKPSTIIVSQTLHWISVSLVNIWINANNGSTLPHSHEWIQHWGQNQQRVWSVYNGRFERVILPRGCQSGYNMY